MIVHDAAAVVLAVAHAALAWLVVVGVVAGMVAVAAVLCVAPATTAARNTLDGHRSAEQGPQAPESHPHRKRRPVPSWAHTEPYSYEEAA